MVELELESQSLTDEQKASVKRRRMVYRPSIEPRVHSWRRSVQPESTIDDFPEWMGSPVALPKFLRGLSEKLALSDKEERIHSALVGVLVWDSYFARYRDSLESARRLPQYLTDIIVPDLRKLFDSFSAELGRDIFVVQNSLERANLFIREQQALGAYAKRSHDFFTASPFLPLYRDRNSLNPAPLHVLYDKVILNPERFRHHSHNFFPDMDRSFFGWVVHNLKLELA